MKKYFDYSSFDDMSDGNKINFINDLYEKMLFYYFKIQVKYSFIVLLIVIPLAFAFFIEYNNTPFIFIPFLILIIACKCIISCYIASIKKIIEFKKIKNNGYVFTLEDLVSYLNKEINHGFNETIKHPNFYLEMSNLSKNGRKCYVYKITVPYTTNNIHIFINEFLKYERIPNGFIDAFNEYRIKEKEYYNLKELIESNDLDKALIYANDILGKSSELLNNF